jgi:hypothetical protein
MRAAHQMKESSDFLDDFTEKALDAHQNGEPRTFASIIARSNDHNADECKRFAGERERFEAWYERTYGVRAFAQNVDHSYAEPTTEMIWAGWQARAAQPINYGALDPQQRLDVARGVQPAPARCEYCDGTGDVHSLDGEWRGSCICQVIGLPPAQPAPVVPEGHVLVPVALTREMHAAMMDAKGTLHDVWASTLSAAPAQGQQVERWIPVNERLPEADTAVLCCQWISKTLYLTFVGYCPDGVEWREFRSGEGEVEPVRQPTHWQPLPEAPTKGGDV